MGWWSTDIMGGDSPLDIKDALESNFTGMPTPEEALAFIDKLSAEWRTDTDIIRQVVGYIMIENGAPFNDQLRVQVLQGIAHEDISGWRDQDERMAVLSEFRKIVEDYPDEGAKVVMPHQSGLFEVIAEKLAGN